jgi:hypothetical protein
MLSCGTAVRFRLGPILPLCFVGLAWSAAWGCYSSVAAPPHIDPPDADDSLPTSTAPDTNTCVPRKPWEGPGVTGVLPVSANMALVINGDRYITGEFNLSGTDVNDPNLGALKAWHESGMLKDLWADAPAVVGSRPWDDPGVTAAYIDRATNAQVIINQFRRWTRNAGNWSVGSVHDDWTVNDAGPPVPDGGRAPWEGVGVTAAGFNNDGTQFWVFSQRPYWIRDNSSADPTNAWRRDAPYDPAAKAPFQTAPLVNGQHVYDGKGVTALFNAGPKYFFISGDKYWVTDLTNWPTAGALYDLDGWKNAPAIGCGR